MRDVTTGGICVMGRRAFGTGIGQITESLVDLLARTYDVALFDLHQTAQPGDTAVLSTGRVVPLAATLEGFATYVYADVLWNGSGYRTYVAPPAGAYRLAVLAFDSDVLPPEWVTILNRDFDAVYFTSPHLVDVALRSGVRVAVGALPLALDTEAAVAAPYRPVVRGRVRFGTLSAYHPRKGLDRLVRAFLDEFADDEPVELVIHSNLAIGDTAAAVATMVEASGSDRVTLSTRSLDREEKDRLLATFDVYVNAAAGEGYSVGPREALALGTCLVVTDIGAHRALLGAPGVFGVRTTHDVPAVYPEIDSRRFGHQRAVDDAHLREQLRAAFDFARSPEAATTAGRRKAVGARFTATALEGAYRAVVDPDSLAVTGAALDETVVLPDADRAVARRAAGRHGRGLGARRIVVPAHDGGFFSLFNTYVSHLTWSLRDVPRRLVVPDWDAGRLLERIAPARPTSFCYSRPDQGNLWNHLFEPPYDLTPDELDDVDFLYGSADVPAAMFNEDREPLLTYVNAYELYRSPQLAQIRRQYRAAIRDHVRLAEPLRAELDEFLATHRDGRFMIAAHVKHPSHAIEQPGGAMADRHAYVGLVRDALRERGIAESSEDWAVFVATDQERVTRHFREEFGEHVIGFDDVERVPAERDEQFDLLPEEQKNAEGHQLQHLIAADVARWSPRLAREVIRDVYAMASADLLLHSVSNVATAAAFLGDAEMRYAEP